ncbi:arginine N-succinyltransferase [Sulfurivermis fontis]|uniref:arginine N-succinyltransferase n=1 Tax=Sulfurivermis fontis TaxID=1972068 RepID=UPI000FDC8C05|nr:arginine N-succinyltransferase [Sulfurivermis fontis]
MTAEPHASAPARTGSGRKITAIVLLTIILTVVLTLWLVYAMVFPAAFSPVTLNPQEKQVLEQKLARLDTTRHTPPARPSALTPERYSEVGARREIALSERELNALLARDPDLAQRLVIDLSDNLASAKLLVPLDPEFPLLGGKTVKLTAGMEIRYADGRPVMRLQGVSVWGVPLPNAWLGNLKNVDLVREFGNDQGFWQAFAAGVAAMEVRDGELRLTLKE